MDRMKTRLTIPFLLAGLGLFWRIPTVSADVSGEPSYSASPSGSVSTKPKATCTITVTRGNNSLAPADVSFRLTATAYRERVETFRYDFGDGQTATGGALSHRYSQGGTYTVTALPLVTGNLEPVSCSTTVILKASPFVAHSSSCTGLQTLATWTASQTTQVKVTGYDNRGTLQSFRVQVVGQTLEQQDGTFDVTIATPGAYTIKAEVKDTTGSWTGDSEACRKEIQVKAAGITTQPQTGPSSYYWLSLLGLAVSWLGAEIWYRLNHRQIG